MPVVRQKFHLPRPPKLWSHLSTVRFAIDATALFRGHNGTIFLAVKLIKEIAQIYSQSLDIIVIGDMRALSFHSIDLVPGVQCLGVDHRENFDVVLRIGQPFDPASVLRMNAIAPVNIYFMLDTIALDCSQLFSPRVRKIWEYVTETADGLIYNSQFTQSQFRRRFNIGSGVSELLSYHSLSPDEYKPGFAGRNSNGSYVLIVGNHYPHKNVVPTYEFLADNVAQKKIAVIGDAPDSYRQPPGRSDMFYKSGDMSHRIMEELYINSEMIIFPSFYEGFGFPILNALAARKPVLVQDNAINREIASLLNSKNLYLYKTSQQMAQWVAKGLKWKDESDSDLHSWKDFSTRNCGIFFDAVEFRVDP